MEKRLLYPIYKQNFDRLFHLIRQEKEEWKKHIGIVELQIFLFEEESVWNQTSFSKYQKGILVSGDCNEKLDSFIDSLEELSLGQINIPASHFDAFMDRGKVYSIE